MLTTTKQTQSGTNLIGGEAKDEKVEKKTCKIAFDISVNVIKPMSLHMELFLNNKLFVCLFVSFNLH